MILQAFEISLMITAIYASTREGMIFYSIRTKTETILDKIIGEKASGIISKPLFECLVCMSSIWTLILFYIFWDGYFISLIDALRYLANLILIVCGINALISIIISKEDE